MNKQKLIRSFVTVAIVGVSLFLYGNIERRVSHFDIGYTKAQSPGSDWVSTATGWPTIHTWKTEHKSGGSSTSSSGSTFDNASIQWWHDNQNTMIWFVVILFTLVQAFRVDHTEIIRLQFTIAALLFITTLVGVFIAVGGSHPHGAAWILLVPISFGITCMITELLYLSWRAIIFSLNSYLFFRNLALRSIRPGHLTHPQIDA